MSHWLKLHKIHIKAAAVFVIASFIFTMVAGCGSKKETGEDKYKKDSVAVNSSKAQKKASSLTDEEKAKTKKKTKEKLNKEEDSSPKDEDDTKNSKGKDDSDISDKDKGSSQNQKEDGKDKDVNDNGAGKQSNTKSYSSYDNTLHGFYFTRNAEHKPAETDPKFKEMFRDTNTVYLGDTSKKYIYLTFDEGYENGYTGHILDVLKENGVKAAFFVTGDYVKRASSLVKRMVDEGHIVGNHTQNHPSLPGLSDEKIKKELTDLADNYAQLTGEDMEFVRPPKGEFSHRTLKITSDLGYKTVFWSWAYADWDNSKKTGTDEIFNRFMSNLHNGEIVLLHAVSQENATVLDKIIKAVKEKGYEFKTLDDIK